MDVGRRRRGEQIPLHNRLAQIPVHSNRKTFFPLLGYGIGTQIKDFRRPVVVLGFILAYPDSCPKTAHSRHGPVRQHDVPMTSPSRTDRIDAAAVPQMGLCNPAAY